MTGRSSLPAAANELMRDVPITLCGKPEGESIYVQMKIGNQWTGGSIGMTLQQWNELLRRSEGNDLLWVTTPEDYEESTGESW